MADKGLTASSAFLHWKPVAHQSFSAEAREDLTMASFAAVRGKAEALDAALRAAYGIGLPEGVGRRVEGEGIAFAWTGPDQWLAIAPRNAERDLERELKATLAGVASVVDQSDGRVVVRIQGPRARDVFAKGVPIDLHPRVFRPGDVAITHASHIGIILWQLDEAPTYEVALFRSYAESFAHWLDESAAEYVSVRG